MSTQQVQQLYEESIRLYREPGDKRRLAFAIRNLGDVAVMRDDYQQAQRLYEESRELFQALGDKDMVARAEVNLREVEALQSECERATTLYQENLRFSREVGDRAVTAHALLGLAVVAGAQQDSERAAQLLGAAAAILKTIGAPPDPWEQMRTESLSRQARMGLGEKAYEAAWSRGQAMSLEGAIAHALGERG